MSQGKSSPLPLPIVTRRAYALVGVLALQSACALFFLADAVADLFAVEFPAGSYHDQFELAVVLALLVGIVFTSLEIGRIVRRQRRLETQLRIASGAFFEILESHFEDWSLTPSERDVALFTIKGLSIAEIAALRNTKSGTIKAQCNAIYRKAGVTGRAQLLSSFIEELANDAIAEP